MESGQQPSGVLKYIRFLVLVAGVGACIQSIVWICLTITGIIIYTICEKDLSGSYGNLIRYTYFTDSACFGAGNDQGTGLYMTADDLLIWECVILALMVLWFLASILLIGGVKESELKPQCNIYLILWSVLTLIISSIDLAVAIFFGLDSTYILNIGENRLFLTQMKDFVKADDGRLVAELISTISGFLMTIALRGFILWFLNVAASMYFIAGVVEINAAETAKQETTHSIISRGPLNAFDSSIEQRSTHWLADAENMDRPKIQNPPIARTLSTRGEVNQGYSGSMDSPMAHNRYQQQQPLASIMKKSVIARNEDRNSQQRAKEYNIPSPDYSPPQMRKPPYRQQASDNSYNNSNFYNSNSYYNNKR